MPRRRNLAAFAGSVKPFEWIRYATMRQLAETTRPRKARKMWTKVS
jgi:hypothetical protein